MPSRSSSTSDSIASSLKLWTRAFGINAEVEFCGFNQVAQQLDAAPASFAEGLLRLLGIECEQRVVRLVDGCAEIGTQTHISTIHTHGRAIG